jgi:hypothetical protein
MNFAMRQSHKQNNHRDNKEEVVKAPPTWPINPSSQSASRITNIAQLMNELLFGTVRIVTFEVP